MILVLEVDGKLKTLSWDLKKFYHPVWLFTWKIVTVKEGRISKQKGRSLNGGTCFLTAIRWIIAEYRRDILYDQKYVTLVVWVGRKSSFFRFPEFWFIPLSLSVSKLWLFIKQCFLELHFRKQIQVSIFFCKSWQIPFK